MKLEKEMKKQSIQTTLTIIFTTILFLTACASPEANQASPIVPTETEHLPDMANPAAVYCVGLGYTMENVTRDGGQDADCIFPNGSRCGQWDFLAGRCGQEFTFCSMHGYVLETGANNGHCRFPDGTFCDEYLYFSGSCAPGDNPELAAEEPTQIMDVYQARDFLAQYFNNQFGLEVVEPWIEQDITPEDAVGSFRTRFVSGPMTIIISAQASAPSPALYTIEEASYIAKGFYWEGTLSFEGVLSEHYVNPPGTILSEEDARKAVMEHITAAYDLPGYDEWTDQGMNPTESNTMVRVYSSGPWVVEVEFEPAAPLIASYHVTADHLKEDVRWEGEITIQGEITEGNISR